MKAEAPAPDSSAALLQGERRGVPWLRPLAVRVIIDALTLVLAATILSLIRLPGQNAEGTYVLDEPLLEISNAGPIDFLLLGLSLALVSAFVRPVLIALTGSWVVRSYGLIALAVNAVVFWLAFEIVTIVADMQVSLPDPRIVWLLVVSTVFYLLLLVVDTLLGLNRPRVADLGEEQPLWHLLDRLPIAGRSRFIENLRLQQVREVVFQYGLDITLSRTPIARLRTVGDRLLGRDPDEFSELSTPAKVRFMLQQLGPTYVKVGQMISSRADVLPEVWRDELDKLQNTVPPFPYPQVEAIIRSELGAAPEVLFESFDHEPLGAASLAQVHPARLPGGQDVVVKVQRPNVKSMVRADLGNMEDIARQAERRVTLARTMNLAAMVHEFGEGVLTELDYRIEAYHALRLAEVVADIEGIHVPAVYLDRSTDRVITMEYVRGVKATQVRALEEAGVDRELVARRLIRAMIKQVLIDGFFHGDPHPGNIVIDLETGRLTFLDLGLVGELDSNRRLELLGLMWSLRQRDPNGLASSILGFCERSGPVDEAAFRSDVRRIVYQYWIYGNADFSRMMSAMFGVLAKHHLKLDQALTLAVKALIQAEELVRTLSPGLPLVDTGYEEATDLLEGEFTADRILGMAKEQAASAAIELGRRLPSLRDATFKWLDQYQRGRFVVTIDTGDLQKGLESVGSVSRNLTIGLIVAGQLIALALVLALVVGTGIVDDELTWLLAFVFIGFLAFSLVVVRRVSRTPQ